MGKDGWHIMNDNWKDSYVESMEQIKFTEKQQERMVDFMVNNAGKKEKHMPASRTGMSFKIRRLAIACICFCIITAGAAAANAAGVFKPVSEAFREVFHLDADTARITDYTGSSLGITDTSGNVSVTADAVLGDDYNFAVVFSIKKEDGTAFKEDDIRALNAEQNDVSFRYMNIITNKKADGQKMGNQGRDFYFYDANPDDPSFQLLYTCTSDIPGSTGEVNALFSDFGYYDSSAHFVTVASGCWNIKFQLDYVNSARHLATGQQIKQGKETIIVKKADISPVGFHIEFETENMEDIEEMPGIVKNFPVELVLTDGKKINLKKKSKAFSLWIENNSTYATYGNTFQQIIPVEQMESLHIGNLKLDF